MHATSSPSLTPSPTISQANPTAQEDNHTQQRPESASETSRTVIDVLDHVHSSGIASSEENTKPIDTDIPLKNPVLTLGGSRYTRNSQSEIIFPGLTLKPGQAATISNTPILLDSAGSYAVVGSKTRSLVPAFAPDAPKVSAVLTLEEASYTAEQDSNGFVINGMNLRHGGTITVAGTPVALGPDGNYAVVGTRTQWLTILSASSDAAPVINVAGTSYTPQSNSGDYIIAGQTLSKAGKVTVAGSVVSLVSNWKSAALDFSGEHFITAAPVAGVQAKPMLTFGESTYTARAGSYDFVIDGQTLTQGGEITVSGVDVSYPTGSYIVVGSSTQRLGATRAAELTFDASTFTADAHGDFVVNGQTLKPGGVIIVNGTAISYAADGADVVIGSKTEFLAFPTGHESKITFERSTYTAGAGSNFVIGGQTLMPGGMITVNGIPISYDADGVDVVVGSETQYFATGADYGETITFEGSTYTANTAGDFVIADQTLTPGGVIIVDGTPISYAADESGVVVGTSTEAVGLGSYIIGGFGNGFDTATTRGSNYTGATFSNRARDQNNSLLSWRRATLVGIVVIVSIVRIL